jgi:hypothetical protein
MAGGAIYTDETSDHPCAGRGQEAMIPAFAGMIGLIRSGHMACNGAIYGG